MIILQQVKYSLEDLILSAWFGLLPERQMQPPLLFSSSFSSSFSIWLLRQTDPLCPSHPPTPDATIRHTDQFM